METDNDATITDATSSLNDLAALTTAHTDWGVKEVSSTLAPGLYRLDIADAVFATGAWSAVVYVMITTSAAAASPMEFVLQIAPGSAGGLVTIGTGANQFKSDASANVTITSASIQAIWDALTTALTTAGSIGKRIADFLTGDAFVRLGAPAGASVSADIAAVKVDTAAILVDTAEIGVAGAGLTNINLPDQTMNITGNITGNLSGSVGSVTGAVGSVTAGVTLAASAVQAIWDALTSALTTAGSIGKLLVDNINATISSRATPAQVNTEVVDVLAVDTYAEPAQGTPPATTTLAVKIGFGYKAWRNKVTQTATTYSLFNDDAATVDHKATVSDDGTTLTRGEIATGP